MQTLNCNCVPFQKIVTFTRCRIVSRPVKLLVYKCKMCISFRTGIKTVIWKKNLLETWSFVDGIISSTVKDLDVLQFGDMSFTVHFTPGHTEGHVVFLLDGTPFGMSDSLFSGDHLFLGGCGEMLIMIPNFSCGKKNPVTKVYF